MEPLLTTTTRAIRIPSRYPAVIEKLKELQRRRWLVDDIKWDQDLRQWPELDEPTKHTVRRILEFFMGFDAIVNDNITNNYTTAVNIAEFKALWQEQETSEVTHQLTYSTAAHVYFPEEVDAIEHAIDDVPAIARMAAWARRWIDRTTDDPSRDFITRLLAFAFIEGIMFCAPFCVIYWFRTRGQLPGLTMSNDLIAGDELTHVEIAQMIYREYIVHKELVPPEEIVSMLREAVELEKEFVTEALKVDLVGLSKEDMHQYVEFVADGVLRGFGLPVYFGTPLPSLLKFMERGQLESKTNFFERRVPEYTQPVASAHATFDDF